MNKNAGALRWQVRVAKRSVVQKWKKTTVWEAKLLLRQPKEHPRKVGYKSGELSQEGGLRFQKLGFWNCNDGHNFPPKVRPKSFSCQRVLVSLTAEVKHWHFSACGWWFWHAITFFVHLVYSHVVLVHYHVFRTPGNPFGSLSSWKLGLWNCADGSLEFRPKGRPKAIDAKGFVITTAVNYTM